MAALSFDTALSVKSKILAPFLTLFIASSEITFIALSKPALLEIKKVVSISATFKSSEEIFLKKSISFFVRTGESK